MDIYLLTAIVMRALRLFALVIAICIVAEWGPSFVRLFRHRPAPVPAPTVSGDVGEERERTRAMFATIAGAIFLFQVGFLAPLPDITVLRVWLVGLIFVIATFLWAIYHHGLQDARFRPRLVATAHVAAFVLCLIFAVVTR